MSLDYARSIGVSNFGLREVEPVIGRRTIPPAVNQVQFNPAHYRRALVDGCWQLDVAPRPTARSAPAGTCRTGRCNGSPSARAGRPHRCYCGGDLQHNLPVIPKSTHRERIHENAQIFDFTLSEQDMAELDGLDQTKGTDRALERKWW